MWLIVITFADGSNALTGPSNGWPRGKAMETAGELRKNHNDWKVEALPVEAPRSFGL